MVRAPWGIIWSISRSSVELMANAVPVSPPDFTFTIEQPEGASCAIAGIAAPSRALAAAMALRVFPCPNFRIFLPSRFMGRTSLQREGTLASAARNRFKLGLKGLE